ncbi:MAG: response regulator [Pseudobdellovibrionaceae bacterium]
MLWNRKDKKDKKDTKDKKPPILSIILHVEDDPLVAMLFETTLSRVEAFKNVRVIPAATGREALDILKSGKHFDMVVLDLHLPDMEGEMVLKELTLSRPETPVILMSGTRFAPEYMEKVKEKTAVLGFIDKPFSPASLSKDLDRYWKAFLAKF